MTYSLTLLYSYIAYYISDCLIDYYCASPIAFWEANYAHITLKNGVKDFHDVVWILLYTLVKFDMFSGHVSFT